MLIEGMSQQEIAEKLEVGKSTVSKWKYKAIGSGEIEERFGRRPWYRTDDDDNGENPF